MAAKPICLICLHKFNESKSKDNLNEKFIGFLQQHLQIPPSSLTLLLDPSKSSVSLSLQLFCDKCKVVISTICKLYQELLTIQNKLRDKLGKLEEIIDDSFVGGRSSGGGEQGEKLLFSWITSQLKGYQKNVASRQILELRILLSHYCKLDHLKNS